VNEFDLASRSAGAARMARYRDRRRRGLRCVTVDVREVEIEYLIRSHYLDPKERFDPIAIRDAMHRWLDRVCPTPTW